MPIATINAVPLEYRLIPGDAGRPYLVFLHEGLGSVSLWRDFPDKVARQTGARALIYSRQGYGQSGPLDAHRAPRFMHDEALVVLPALLQHLHIERPILIGHSDGASIALIRAADDADAVRATVLMAPHVFVEAITRESIAHIAETFETTDLRTRLARHHAHVDDAFHGWSRIWLDPRFQSWSLGAETQRLAVPTLVIQGADDTYGTLAQVDAICEAAPGPVQRVILNNCGHVPFRDQERAVLDAITAFVERVTQPAAATRRTAQ
jgi:pimeloyl-ACP methyl ester carboxylesterase